LALGSHSSVHFWPSISFQFQPLGPSSHSPPASRTSQSHFVWSVPYCPNRDLPGSLELSHWDGGHR
jgi:hypothetical protein